MHFNDDTRVYLVIQTFVSKIEEFQEQRLIPKKLDYPIKAIAWRKENDDKHKLALKSYCPKFCKEKVAIKQDYDNLAKSYINSILDKLCDKVIFRDYWYMKFIILCNYIDNFELEQKSKQSDNRLSNSC